MRNDLLELKREAKREGVDIELKVSRDSQGEYTVEHYGKVLAQGYNVTDCRVSAIGEILENHYERLERENEKPYTLSKDEEGRIWVLIDGDAQTYGWTEDEANELAKDFTR